MDGDGDGDGDGVCSSRIYVKAGGGYGGEGGGGGGGGKGSGSSSSKCGRWNPTAEQVKVLTELFKSGLRTPSSDQIQKISHHLSFYGKIESKNVFYWFQNHKARDRQKRRKLNNNNNSNNNNSLSLSDHNFILPPPSSSTSSSSIPNFAELEAERRMTKTLQLFPLNSIDDAPGRDDHLHFRSLNGNHYEDPTPFSRLVFD